VYTGFLSSPSLCVLFLCSGVFAFVLAPVFPFLTLYFFFGLCFVCSVFLGWLLCFSRSFWFSRFYFSSPRRCVFFLFLLWFLLFCSGFSSPFYRETCPSTSPAFAGLLFKLQTGSWARDEVHDLLQISCWIGFIRANVGDDEQCFQNGAVVSSGMTVFQFSP